MRIFKFWIVSSLFLLSSCGNQTDSNYNSISQYQQEVSHLSQYFDTNTDSEETDDIINYDVCFGKWIKYLDYSDMMLNKSENEFRNSIKKTLLDCQSQNINTVFFQVRAFGDAYYQSDIFVKGTFLNGNFDPLSIAIEEAHKLKISVHAWINPLRCQTAEEFQSITDNYILKQWFNKYQGKYICNVDGRMWLNPAYTEVAELINDGISEIIENYAVDGIHIDDYFYPTTDTAFDESEFKKSNTSNLSQWRIENINELVKSMYNTVKSYNENILFGISPQGNISQNYSSQYADVKKWCTENGFCDYIVPQIYFGFKNQTCPFTDTFQQWYSMTEKSDVSLCVGLAVYKSGKEDKWAGTGKNEWIEDPEVIKKQQDYLKDFSDVGYSLYS